MSLALLSFTAAFPAPAFAKLSVTARGNVPLPLIEHWILLHILMHTQIFFMKGDRLYEEIVSNEHMT